MKSLNTAFSFAPPSILSLTICREQFLVPYTIITMYLHLQTVKETIGVGVNEKAALSSDKNCPFVYINFDFTLVNKVASL